MGRPTGVVPPAPPANENADEAEGLEGLPDPDDSAPFPTLTLPTAAAELTPLLYNHPGLTVDLGVGLWAWPMPIDWDEDGDLDLVVACPDKPYGGIYLFENRTGGKMPVFEPAVKVGAGVRNMQVSYVNGRPHVLTPATEWLDFRKNNFRKRRQ